MNNLNNASLNTITTWRKDLNNASKPSIKRDNPKREIKGNNTYKDSLNRMNNSMKGIR